MDETTMKSRSIRTTAVRVSVVALVASAALAQVTTVLVSKAPDGTPANAVSVFPQITPDGRYVVFTSVANNLGPPDISFGTDAYVWDRQLNTMDLVSLDYLGMQTNQSVGASAITPDGRFVMMSTAGKLAPEDNNYPFKDAYLRDRLLRTTVLVSKKLDGSGVKADDCGGADLSDDGRFVIFLTRSTEFGGRDTDDDMDVYWRDVQTGLVKRVSVSSNGVQGHGNTYYPQLSGDGRFVFYESIASNLVRGDANQTWDVFGHDVLTGRTMLVDRDSSGAQANGPCDEISVTPDGRYVAFMSKATNLDPVHDLNGTWDIYWRDNLTGQVMLCSRTPSGFAGNGCCGVGGSGYPSISANGRYVAFHSYSSDLIPFDATGPYIPDVYRFDTVTGQVMLVSQSSAGIQANGYGFEPEISGDGGAVVYESDATNLATVNPGVDYNLFLTELPVGP
jgi:Tol biopolymer transport system component